MKRLVFASLISLQLIGTAAFAAEVDEDRDALFQLGLMQGHLMVGHELLQAGQPDLAQPHFGHPVTEIYGDISGYLTEKHVPQFKQALEHLDSTVRHNPTNASIESGYQTALADIETARAAASRPMQGSVTQRLGIYSDILDAAAGEYGESLKDGRIVNLTEYHDSHGFVAFVEAELDRISATHPSSTDAARIERFRTVLARVKGLVGSLMPTPEQTVASAEDYHTLAHQARVAGTE